MTCFYFNDWKQIKMFQFSEMQSLVSTFFLFYFSMRLDVCLVMPHTLFN